MKIIITKNYKTLSTLAASLVIKQIKKKKSSIFGLPTGHTPQGLYQELTNIYNNKQISFKFVKTFNLDEYVGIRAKDSRSYHSYMQKNFFNKIDIKKTNIYLPNEEADDLKKECANYEKLIKKFPIDLLILGIGHDGHIGFNEPGSKFSSKTRTINLLATTKASNAKYFGGQKKVPTQAITMGLSTIMKAKKIILLVSGNDKANIIKKALKEKITQKIPASILQKHPDATIILDETAATKLIKLL